MLRTVFSLIFAVLVTGNVFADRHSVIGLLPFGQNPVPEQVVAALTEAVGEVIAEHVEAEVVDLTSMRNELPCQGEQPCEEISCPVEAGRASNADFVLCIVLSRNESAYTVILRLVDTYARDEIWSRGFRVRGGPDTLITDLPSAIESSVPFGSIRSRAESPKVEPDADLEPMAPAPVTPREKLPMDNGIASTVAIGVEGYVALGSTRREQSPGGFLVYGVMPVGAGSQIRGRAGMPLSYSSQVSDSMDDALPPIYAAAEYEWGWNYFGITAGLAYIYFPQFTKTWTYYEYDYSYSYSSSEWYDATQKEERYPSASGFNVTMGIRGGKPNAGFVGRVSWPLGFTIQGKDEKNFLLDYSAFGVFPLGKRFKMGFGFNGAFIRREMDADSVRTIRTFTIPDAGSNPGTGFEEHSTNQFCSMVPVMRFSGLISETLIAGIGLELGGLIFPRTSLEGSFVSSDGDNGANWWKPSISASLTFGFGKLKGPHVYEGTF